MQSYLYKSKKVHRGRRLLIAILVLLIILTAWYQLAIHRVSPAGPMSYEVVAGANNRSIAHDLKSLGVIDSSLAFQINAMLNNVDHLFQVGIYNIPADATIDLIVAQLTHTQGYAPREEKTITLIEGWTSKQMGEYLVEQGVLINLTAWDAHVSSVKPFKAEYDFLNGVADVTPLEGFLFPDTYRIFSDATAEDIVRKLLDNFAVKLSQELRQQIQANNMTIYDTIILASIIEREVSAPADQAQVASIFYKRLNAGIGLQADSTVNYITGKDVPAVSIADTEIDNPYNTYKYAGLPPGPISNPGLSALQAAIYPERNNYYYFLTTPDDTVIYSQTFEEHRQNKFKYL